MDGTMYMTENQMHLEPIKFIRETEQPEKLFILEIIHGNIPAAGNSVGGKIRI